MIGFQTKFNGIVFIMINGNIGTINSKDAISIPCFWLSGKLENIG